ncbi:diguanylate cyclase [Chitinimonas arctica]|uniref:diguanylate cyclase n=1 Tax=Chitinimonas arctica TaxID=2594795 RepID=A0A516SC72_9NEIS|nr:diguanylate cyclase [Chitinimonas arctica]QDQ25746.1 diguanylate cyclase [Chitinimonas arctica]
MGLRGKLLFSLVALLGVLGLASTLILRSSVLASYQQIELEASQDDMARLVQTLEAELLQLNQVTREWGNWTELYNYLANRNRDFRNENLSPTNLALSGVWYLAIYDLAGHTVEAHSLNPRTSQPVDLGQLAQSDNPIRAILGQQPEASPDNCGLARVAQGLLMLCRLPILDSEGKLPSRGVIVMGRLLDPPALQRIANQTRLQFELLSAPTQTKPPPTGEPRTLFSPLGYGPVGYLQGEDRYELHWTLRDLAGRPCGELLLPWPRSIMTRGREVLVQAQWQLTLLTLLGAFGMLLVIDRVLLVRLKRLSNELDDIRAGQDWAKRTSDSSADEIGGVAQHTNELLTVIAAQMLELEQRAQTDPLTGLANRRAFDQRLLHEIRLQRRKGQPLALVMLDVDFFKRYNDAYGHQAGDAALRVVARCMSGQAKRPGDLPVRLGGEEFAILLADTNLAAACDIAERVRLALLAEALPHKQSDVAEVLSISLGVAMLQSDDTPESLYARADTALYAAKHAGRNQVVSKATETD